MMNSSPEQRLSAAGEMRREAMLAELMPLVENTHRCRRMRRRMQYGLVAAATGAALIGIVVHSLPTPQDDATPSNRMAHASLNPSPDLPPTETKIPACVIQRVQTDPSIVDRFRATPSRLIERIDDQTLIETLASINRPAGIIRYGDRVALTRPVDDESLGIGQ